MDDHSPLRRSLSDGPKRHPTSAFRPVKVNSNYCIETITTEQGLGSIEDDWNRLSQTAELPNAFMTLDWFRIWNQRLAEEDRAIQRHLRVLVLKKHGAVAGISPLIYRKVSRFGCAVRKLQFVGREGDYNDLVVGDNPAAQTEAIVDFLAQTQDHWDLIDLRDLRNTENALPLIKAALARARLNHRVLPEERCPYLRIEAPWAEMVTGNSRSPDYALRKQQFRLKRMSAEGLRIRIIENPRDEAGLLEKLIAVERRKQVHGKLSQPFIGRYPEVFQSLFDTLGPRGWIHIALMERGEHPLAWSLGFRCGKKLWGFLTAYDHAFFLVRG
jgi:CelD/BcsL family acetyltransferase involved in cellulose biosynthesis